MAARKIELSPEEWKAIDAAGEPNVIWAGISVRLRALIV